MISSQYARDRVNQTLSLKKSTLFMLKACKMPHYRGFFDNSYKIVGVFQSYALSTNEQANVSITSA